MNIENIVTFAKLSRYDGKIKAWVTAKISSMLPTKLTDLTNDGNFVTDASYVHTDNNYTTEEKTKLGGVAAGAQVNVIETVQVNGVDLTPDSNKKVNVLVPTSLSGLDNSTTNYQSGAQVDTKIATALANQATANFKVVDAIPTTDNAEDGVIYLVAHPGHEDSKDNYDEYIKVIKKVEGVDTPAIEKIGNTDIDLSGYAQIADYSEATDSQIDSLFPQA